MAAKRAVQLVLKLDAPRVKKRLLDEIVLAGSSNPPSSDCSIQGMREELERCNMEAQDLRERERRNAENHEDEDEDRMQERCDPTVGHHVRGCDGRHCVDPWEPPY